MYDRNVVIGLTFYVSILFRTPPLFRVRVIDYLESKSISKSIIDILWLCTELEDVESLIPDKLNEETIKLINQLLAKLDDFDGLSDHVSLFIDIK